MRLLALPLGSFILTMTAAGGPLMAAPSMDLAPPRVQEVQIAPAILDTGSAPADLAIRARVTDAESGVRGVAILLLGPSGQRLSGGLYASPGEPGGEVFTNLLVLPRYSEPGRWTVESLYVSDFADNVHEAGSADLVAAGFTAGFTVTGSADTEPPKLLGFTVSPPAAEVSTDPVMMRVEFVIEDSLSGFDGSLPDVSNLAQAVADFVSPSGNRSWSARVTPRDRIAGNATNGTYAATTFLPPSSEPGSWKLRSLYLSDAVGNMRQWGVGAVRSLGFTTSFTVSGNPGPADTEPPSIAQFGFDPSTGPVGDAERAIRLTATVTDAQSGVALASATFRHATAEQYATVDLLPADGGPDAAGTHTGILRLDPRAAPGIWRLAEIDLRDVAGNMRRWRLEEAILRGFPTEFRANGAGDASPPQVRSVSVEPASVDSRVEDAIARLTLRVADDLAGVQPRSSDSRAFLRASFASPSGRSTLEIDFDSGTRTSGLPQDGTYSRAFRIPPLSESGVWTLAGLSASDSLGNARHWDPVDLVRSGLTAAFAVTGESDLQPPQLRALRLTPVSAEGQALVAVELSATDDRGGLSWSSTGGRSRAGIQLSVLSPSGRQGSGIFLGHFDRAGGTSTDATFTGEISMPPFAEPGIWTVDLLVLSDAFGNRTEFTAAGLANLGFPASFPVAGTADVNPPVLADFAIAPGPILLTRGPTAAALTLRIKEDLSGFAMDAFSGRRASGSVTFVGPSQDGMLRFQVDPSMRISGTPNDGTYFCAAPVEPDLEPGLYVLAGASFSDLSGNVLNLDLAAFRRLGFPVTLEIQWVPALTIQRFADGLALSWPSQAEGFALHRSSSIPAPSAAWEPILDEPVVVGSERVVFLPIHPGQDFLRLIRKP